MNDLVIAHDGQPTTTSLVIAEGVGNEHRAVIQLVRQNLTDFEEFGGVAFEMQPFDTAGGVQQRTVAILNREHAMLLMTFMRNSSVVREFKKNLIKAFVEMEHQLSVKAPAFDPATLTRAEILQIALNAEEERLALQAANAEMAPKAAYVDTYVADEDLIQIRTIANQLNIGEQALRNLLIEKGWIYRICGQRWSNKKGGIVTEYQYRAHADKKAYFRLIPCHEAPRINGEVKQTLKVTPMGAERIAAAVKRWSNPTKEIEITK